MSELSTGDHMHCFCSQDTGGNIMCCKCGTLLMDCRSCPVDFCVLRNHLERAASNSEANIFVADCPIASPNYGTLYKRILA